MNRLTIDELLDAYLKKLGPRASKENTEAVELSITALEEKLIREEAEAALEGKGETQ